MEFQKIELLAAKKEPLPDAASLEDRMCFACLKELYRAFYGKRLTKEEALREKNRIRTVYEKARKDHWKQCAAWAQYQENIRRASDLRGTLLRGLKEKGSCEELFPAALECIGRMCCDQMMRKKASNLQKEASLSCSLPKHPAAERGRPERLGSQGGQDQKGGKA